jgi:hypothetical protein
MASLIAEITRVLDERDRMFPKRSESNTEEMHRLLDEFFASVDAEMDESWAPEPQLTEAVRPLADEAVFLCGYMKSGTTLLLELLDGHDEIIALPGDSFSITRVSEPGREEKYSWESWRENWVKRMVNPTGQRPFWLLGTEDNHYIDFLHYLDYWYNFYEKTWRAPVLSTIFSYFCANPKKPACPRVWIEKTPGNEFRLDWILDLFPRAKFVHITRDPRENMASLKRLYQSRSWEWRPKEIARTFARSSRSAVKNRQRLGTNRYHVLQYEALTSDPKQEMGRVADFMGISWHKSLLDPTVNRVVATANTMYEDRKASGFVRRSAESKWEQVLSRKEKKYIARILLDAQKVGYHWHLRLSEYPAMWFDHIFKTSVR